MVFNTFNINTINFDSFFGGQVAFSSEIINDVFIIKITSERATIDISGSLKELIYGKIEKGYNKIIMDLSFSQFVDSSFLGTLVAGLKRATMKDGELKICGLQPPVKTMFELTRLNKIFDVCGNIDDALKKFN